MLDVTFTGVHEITTKCLVDSGALNTIFDSGLAYAAGVDLTDAETGDSNVGGGTVELKFVKLHLSVPSVTDPHEPGEPFIWEARVAFADNWGARPGLLGHEFFRFFTVTFRAADLEFEIEPNLE
ncbi:hypothetical protein [Rhodococcus aetherivorans]|uniref:hypothetical protein n=1 Tax=Rhodococcus aetherivorans TaxID=191292 RepID=UPI001E5B352E|nr:hypothetical protein [Rhodococcus aetherivorans]UGQ41210.1 hypothetical protein LRQ66_24370 [Rhodococcus aetherivorans]